MTGQDPPEAIAIELELVVLRMFLDRKESQARRSLIVRLLLLDVSERGGSDWEQHDLMLSCQEKVEVDDAEDESGRRGWKRKGTERVIFIPRQTGSGERQVRFKVARWIAEEAAQRRPAPSPLSTCLLPDPAIADER